MSARQRFAVLFLVVFALAPLLAADTEQHAMPSPSPSPGCAECGTKPVAIAPMAAMDCMVEPPTPVITLKIKADSCSPESKDITYRIKVENRSSAFAHHVLVRNPLPANARLVRASPEPFQKDPEIQWKINTMAPGACFDILLVLAPTNGEDVRNCTRVVFEHGQCVTTRQVKAGPQVPSVPPVVDEKGGKLVPVPQPGQGAKLKLKVEGPKQQFANLPAKYFLTVTNSGNEATNIQVTAVLPAQADYLSSSNNGALHAQQVAWNLGRIDVGASRTVEVLIKAKAAGELCIKGNVYERIGDNLFLKDVAETCTTFAGQSALTMDTIDTFDPVAMGGQTSYLIRITNQGEVNLTNLKLLASIPAEMELVTARGPSEPPPNDKLPPRKDGRLNVAFDPLKELAPGAKATYEVMVKARQAGDVRFQVVLTADQLEAGAVYEQESTLLYLAPKD